MEALIPDSSVEAMARWMKLLADETRLRILSILLAERELNVTSLCERLGQSQPAVSHHLGLLREHGLLDCRRAGKHNYYSVVSSEFTPLRDLIAQFCPSDGTPPAASEPA